MPVVEKTFAKKRQAFERGPVPAMGIIGIASDRDRAQTRPWLVEDTRIIFSQVDGFTKPAMLRCIGGAQYYETAPTRHVRAFTHGPPWLVATKDIANDRSRRPTKEHHRIGRSAIAVAKEEKDHERTVITSLLGQVCRGDAFIDPPKPRCGAGMLRHGRNPVPQKTGRGIARNLKRPIPAD